MSAVTSAAVSPDGRHIVSGSEDQTVMIWNLESGVQIGRLSGHRGWANSVAVSPDSRHIVSVSEDQGIVAIWHLETGQRLASLSLDGSVRSVAWHPGGRFILAGDVVGDLYCLEFRAR